MQTSKPEIQTSKPPSTRPLRLWSYFLHLGLRASARIAGIRVYPGLRASEAPSTRPLRLCCDLLILCDLCFTCLRACLDSSQVLWPRACFGEVVVRIGCIMSSRSWFNVPKTSHQLGPRHLSLHERTRELYVGRFRGCRRSQRYIISYSRTGPFRKTKAPLLICDSRRGALRKKDIKQQTTCFKVPNSKYFNTIHPLSKIISIY